MGHPRVKVSDEPAHYLLIANDVRGEKQASGALIAKTLADRQVWLVSQYTPFRQAYRGGDRVLFYVAGRGARCVIGEATIAGTVSESTESEKQLASELGLRRFRQKLPLADVRIWASPVLLKPLVEQLDFIKDKHNWGLNLRQAAARISANDFAAIQHAAEES